MLLARVTALFPVDTCGYLSGMQALEVLRVGLGTSWKHLNWGCVSALNGWSCAPLPSPSTLNHVSAHLQALEWDCLCWPGQWHCSGAGCPRPHPLNPSAQGGGWGWGSEELFECDGGAVGEL